MMKFFYIASFKLIYCSLKISYIRSVLCSYHVYFYLYDFISILYRFFLSSQKYHALKIILTAECYVYLDHIYIYIHTYIFALTISVIHTHIIIYQFILRLKKIILTVRKVKIYCSLWWDEHLGYYCVFCKGYFHSKRLLWSKWDEIHWSVIVVRYLPIKVSALARPRWFSANQNSATFGERQRKKGCASAAIVWPENIKVTRRISEES